MVRCENYGPLLYHYISAHDGTIAWTSYHVILESHLFAQTSLLESFLLRRLNSDVNLQQRATFNGAGNLHMSVPQRQGIVLGFWTDPDRYLLSALEVSRRLLVLELCDVWQQLPTFTELLSASPSERSCSPFA